MSELSDSGSSTSGEERHGAAVAKALSGLLHDPLGDARTEIQRRLDESDGPLSGDDASDALVAAFAMDVRPFLDAGELDHLRIDFMRAPDGELVPWRPPPGQDPSGRAAFQMCVYVPWPINRVICW